MIYQNDCQYVAEIVEKIKSFKPDRLQKPKDFKILCGLKPYKKNAVKKPSLYKNGIAFIVDPISLTVPCSLLRVYSLFFKSTDKAALFIKELYRKRVSHIQFAEYLFYVHGIKLINCLEGYGNQITNLLSTDLLNANELLCIGVNTFHVLTSKKIIPPTLKSGYIVHSSGLVHHLDEYFKTWYLYDDSCIHGNNGISFSDFNIFKLC